MTLLLEDFMWNKARQKTKKKRLTLVIISWMNPNALELGIIYKQIIHQIDQSKKQIPTGKKKQHGSKFPKIYF